MQQCWLTNLLIWCIPTTLLLALAFFLPLRPCLASRDLLPLWLLHPLFVPLADSRQDLRSLILALGREDMRKSLKINSSVNQSINPKMSPPAGCQYLRWCSQTCTCCPCRKQCKRCSQSEEKTWSMCFCWSDEVKTWCWWSGSWPPKMVIFTSVSEM